MTDANAGTPSSAATSSGGGSNNGQRNSNNNNNNRNNNNDNRNKQQVSDTAIIKEMEENRKVFHLPNSSHRGAATNADFQFILECLARFVANKGLKSSAHFATSILNVAEVLPTEPTKPKMKPAGSTASDDQKEEARETYRAEMSQWSSAMTDYNREIVQLDGCYF